MSFLDQLKLQAEAVKSRQDRQQVEHDACTNATEQACQTVFLYLKQVGELARMVCGQPSRFA